MDTDPFDQELARNLATLGEPALRELKMVLESPQPYRDAVSRGVDGPARVLGPRGAARGRRHRCVRAGAVAPRASGPQHVMDDDELRGFLTDLTPSARDLLRRVLVMDHRERDDVARHLMHKSTPTSGALADLIDEDASLRENLAHLGELPSASPKWPRPGPVNDRAKVRNSEKRREAFPQVIGHIGGSPQVGKVLLSDSVCGAPTMFGSA